jgi:hypothetical protein
MAVGGTVIIGEPCGVAEIAEGITLANAPAKFSPITAIAVKTIAAIIGIFIFLISISDCFRFTKLNKSVSEPLLTQDCS